MKKNITFIGCGNMGSSLIKGLINSGYPTESLFGIEPEDTTRKTIERELGIRTATFDEKIIADSDVLVLAVKPQILLSTLNTIKPHVSQNTLIISIAAGINCQSIEHGLTANTAIVRVMPNTPSLINLGSAGLYANNNVSDDQKDLAEKIVQAVGITTWVKDEKLIDVITAISGSGPAYYFFFMEIMERIATELGLGSDQAAMLVKQTALGAATMANMSEQSLTQLRQNVTSPGGTTEAAINSLSQQDLEKIIRQALIKAKDRSEELSEQFGNKKNDEN